MTTPCGILAALACKATLRTRSSKTGPLNSIAMRALFDTSPELAVQGAHFEVSDHNPVCPYDTHFDARYGDINTCCKSKKLEPLCNYVVYVLFVQ